MMDYCISCVLISIAGAYFILRWCLRQPKVGDYGHKYVVITGCDSGFGKLLAQRLDGIGLNVFAGCLTPKGISDLESSCSDKLKGVLLDVTKKEGIERMRKLIQARLPPNTGLWALINNAGIMGPLAFPDCLTREQYDKVFAVNLFGVIDMSTEFLPLLRLAKGRIVNVASVLGRVSIRACIPYNISKYGVEAYSDGLRRALRSQHVSVHILEPGVFQTGLFTTDETKRLIHKYFDASPKEVQEYYGKESIDNFTLVADLMDRASHRFHAVINAHVHAITARYPKYRYLIGVDAHIYFWPCMWLPEWISDFLLDPATIVAPAGARKKKTA